MALVYCSPDGLSLTIKAFADSAIDIGLTAAASDFACIERRQRSSKDDGNSTWRGSSSASSTPIQWP
jgi:hypothetical protein